MDGYIEVKREFVNEQEREIKMEVRAITAEEVGGIFAVRVIAESPHSAVDHSWTRMEAQALRDMLCEAIGSPSPAGGIPERCQS